MYNYCIMEKRIIISLPFILLIGLLFTSCSDYLDKLPDGQKNEKDIFTKYDYVDGLVTHLYEQAKMANHPVVFYEHYSTAGITDECDGCNQGYAIPRQYHTGNWGPDHSTPDNIWQQPFWSGLYGIIREANVILEGIKKYNTPDNPRDGREGDLKRRIGETYFFRAYMYYLLLRMYGEVPYVDHVITPSENHLLSKSSFHFVVDRILEDLQEAYDRVYPVCPDIEFGRVDQGACLGLKAMTLWMAATPMWNGGNLPKDTRIYKEEYAYDSKRWERAKQAALDVMNFKVEGKLRYSLFEKFGQDDFTDMNNADGTSANNKMVPRRLWDMYYDSDAIRNEWIWFATRTKDSYWAGDLVPPSMGGYARQRPIQEQVDEYEVIIDGYGYPIYSDEAKGVYDDSNPYVNRDPRFYRDIIYHGATFNGKQMNLAEGVDALTDSYVNPGTHTGYYLRKLIKEGWRRDLYYWMHGPAIIRLPHIIYIYCEAVNNLEGPSQEIYDMINNLRKRSFMAPMPPEVLDDKNLMNEYIQRERRVEFFYENDRMWRCRLYLEPDAEQEKENEWKAKGYPEDYYPYPKTQRTSHGMRPVEDPNGKIIVNGKKYRMERFRVKVGDADFRLFITPQHYLFPISTSELKQASSLVQNPGW